MPERLLKVLSLGVFGSLLGVLVATSTAQEPIPLIPPGGQPEPRQPGAAPEPEPEPIPLPLPKPNNQPAQPVQPAEGDDVEVLAKGPVHEAFATTAEAPAETSTVKKQPPEPIEELPPDQKPEGDNVQWLPGYWSWDEDAEKFIWVSGFWRQPPPNRVWVPGSWREANGGWQWVAGFWQPVNPLPLPNENQNQPQAQPEIEYLPEPPASLESGPSVEAPGESYFYAPGCWVWRGTRYAWRPGVWVEYRTDWVWVPARYHWTPAGYVFCDGYWDYPLARRGVLFAPVAFAQPIYTHPAFVYTPTYVVSEPCMFGALFVRRGCNHYYFGDYFDNRYAFRGYSAWCGFYTRNGFSVGFGTGRRWGYDPLWSYYSVTYRNTPTWRRGVGELYTGRYRGDVVRPPTTLVHQNTTINNITRTNVRNVTNNITVVNGAPSVNNKDVSNVAMVAPLKVAPDLQKSKFQAVNAEARRTEATQAKQIREVANQRTKLETAVVKQRPAVTTPAQPGTPAQPKSIKLDVPKTAITRAQVKDEKKAPPPSPVKSANTNVNPGAKIGSPKPVVNPPSATPPAAKPVITPPAAKPVVNPQPKVDPKPITNSPVNPLPKVDPKPVTNQPSTTPPAVKPVITPPAAKPVVNPQPKPPVVNPSATPPAAKPPVLSPTPKVDPKPITNPPVNPAPKPVVTPPQSKPVIAPPSASPSAPKPIVAPPVSQPRPSVVTPPTPQPQPKPVVAPPVSQPKPVVVSPPAARPVVNPTPKPTAPAQPRPTVTAPTMPPKVVQPPKAPAAPPAKPAPVGKPPAKNRK